MPLDAASAQAIADKLSSATKAMVLLDRAVDPAILGGVVAQVGSLVYDGSVRTQLEELRRTLKSVARHRDAIERRTGESWLDGNPRRRDQPHHPRADQGLREEGRGRRDRHRALVGDGIARIYGLAGAMAGELLEFPHGVRGIVLNLEEDNVGVAHHGRVRSTSAKATRSSAPAASPRCRSARRCSAAW